MHETIIYGIEGINVLPSFEKKLKSSDAKHLFVFKYVEKKQKEKLEHIDARKEKRFRTKRNA